MAQRADLSGAAFGKITAVYEHVDKNEHLSINGLLMAITDKMSKTSRLSVKIQSQIDRIVQHLIKSLFL